MRLLITQAIHEHRLLRLSYDGKTRTVEPHILGMTTAKHEGLFCRQISPPSAAADQWRLLRLDKIMELRLLETRFEPPEQGSHPPMEFFSTKYATLEPT